MNIALIKDKKCFEAFEDNIGLSEKDIFIALSVEAVNFLVERGVKFKCISDLKFKFEPIFSEKNYKDLLSWSNHVDRVILNEIPKLRDKFIRPIHVSLHAFRTNIFDLYNEIEKLTNISKLFPKSNIYASMNEKHDIYNYVLEIFENDNRLKILKRIPISIVFPHPDWFSKQRPFKRFAKYLIKDRKFKKLSSFLCAVFNAPLIREKNYILVMLSAFDGKYLFGANINKNIIPIFWDDIQFIHSKKIILYKEIIDTIKEKIKGMPFYQRKGLCFEEFFLLLVEKVLVQNLTKMEYSAEKYLSLQKKFGFKFLYTTYCTTEADLVFNLANKIGVPSVFALHGGTVGAVKDFIPISYAIRDYQNGETSSYLLCYSEEIKSFLEKIKSIFSSYTFENIVTGSIYFNQLGPKERN